MADTVLHLSEFYRIERLDGLSVVRITRLPRPFESEEDVETACAPVQQTLDREGRARVQLLIDTREIVGRNDPRSESMFADHRRRMATGFKRVAILVKTTAGKLHTQRLLLQDGSNLHAQTFLDEREAMAFLTE